MVDLDNQNKPLHLQNKQVMFANAAALALARSEAHARNVEASLAAMEEERAENPAYSPCPRERIVTSQEQTLMCKVYETKVAAYVKATSVAVYKRFYLKQAVFNYDPRIILLTCIFLAAKIEGSYIPLKDFLAKVPASARPEAEIVRDMELIVADTMGFEFKVHQVRWPLHGLFLDLQPYLTSNHTHESRKELFQTLAKLYSRARELAQIALCSDLQFTHWSSQVALGCFVLASKQLNLLTHELDRYISFRIHWIDTDTVAALKGKLEEVVEAIAAQQEFERLAKDATSVVSLKAKEANAKLAGHEKRKREEEAAKNAKRQKKSAKESQNRASLSSIFD
ncbi:hypothetical protein HDU98_003430 [Podochytrium sp. JEL0797]|nr:hypothetical protein HDU98_003430 [Podochytrium sp. JEL0797]